MFTMRFDMRAPEGVAWIGTGSVAVRAARKRPGPRLANNPDATNEAEH